MWPKLVEHGDFFLPTYGVLVAAAYLAGIWIATRLARKAGLDPDKITNLAIYCAIAGMLGAKLLMFVFDWRLYAENPSEIFSLATLQAAGVYQGGLILALVTAVWYIRSARLPGLLTADVFAPGIALGHAIGRLGCFSAGCCWGQSCDRPWAVTFTKPAAEELTGVPLGVPLHPTQLYEAFAYLVLFGFVIWLFNRPHRQGAVIGWFLVLSSVARFLVEFVRYHDQGLYAGLSLTQWISFATLAAGIWLLVKAGGKPAAAEPAARTRVLS